MTDAREPRHVHPFTFLTLEESFEEHRFKRPYLKTYEFDGDYIDERHAHFATAAGPNGMIDVGIDGWLLPPDALKLYEMAYFCGGDVLELGTYRGLSSAVVASALDAAGRGCLVTCDLDPAAIEIARKNLWSRRGSERVHLFALDAIRFVENLGKADRRFEFVFVDHSHHYDHVKSTCELLSACMKPGSFVLFHDFNDPRNRADDAPDYGVYQAVTGSLPSTFEFWGIYGCAGLYRYCNPQP